MSPMGLLPFMNYQQRHEELLKQVAQSRQLEQAMKSKRANKHGLSAILAMLGMDLSSPGFSMEVGYGNQDEPATLLSRQSNPGGC